MKTTFYLLKVTDNGIESSVDGIEHATDAELRELQIAKRDYLDHGDLLIYLQSNPNIPVGCDIELQFLCASEQPT